MTHPRASRRPRLGRSCQASSTSPCRARARLAGASLTMPAAPYLVVTGPVKSYQVLPVAPSHGFACLSRLVMPAASSSAQSRHVAAPRVPPRLPCRLQSRLPLAPLARTCRPRPVPSPLAPTALAMSCLPRLVLSRLVLTFLVAPVVPCLTHMVLSCLASVSPTRAMSCRACRAFPGLVIPRSVPPCLACRVSSSQNSASLTTPRLTLSCLPYVA